MQAYITAVTILTVAAACDYFTKKIPNLLIIIGYALALVTMVIVNGTEQFYIYFIRALWPIPALFIFYFLKALGAGDIKLFSVISVFCPTDFFIRFIILSLVTAAIWGIVKLSLNRELHTRMLGVASHIRECVVSGEVSHYVPAGKSSYICFSVCMLFGFLLSIGWEVLL